MRGGKAEDKANRVRIDLVPSLPFFRPTISLVLCYSLILGKVEASLHRVFRRSDEIEAKVDPYRKVE
jgi:hypothetical protein